MARVCEDWFPVGSYPRQRLPGFFMDDFLKAQLDLLIKNVRNDWDFTLIVSGSGWVRVGKSVLAMQIGSYWTYQLWKLYDVKVPFTVKDNFVFRGDKLIQQGNHLGKNFKYSALIFDEAGADLEGRKTMHKVTQDVLDFFRECGQYNLLNILVIPEFFDLPKGIAVSRSTCLLDVKIKNNEGLFERGFYNFYSRRHKKNLYRKGKKEINYKVERYNFQGKFDNVHAINELEYRRLKAIALSERGEIKIHKDVRISNALMRIMNKELKIGQSDIARRLLNYKIKIDPTRISDRINLIKSIIEGMPIDATEIKPSSTNIN